MLEGRLNPWICNGSNGDLLGSVTFPLEELVSGLQTRGALSACYLDLYCVCSGLAPDQDALDLAFLPGSPRLMAQYSSCAGTGEGWYQLQILRNNSMQFVQVRSLKGRCANRSKNETVMIYSANSVIADSESILPLFSKQGNNAKSAELYIRLSYAKAT